MVKASDIGGWTVVYPFDCPVPEVDSRIEINGQSYAV